MNNISSSQTDSINNNIREVDNHFTIEDSQSTNLTASTSVNDLSNRLNDSKDTPQAQITNRIINTQVSSSMGKIISTTTANNININNFNFTTNRINPFSMIRNPYINSNIFNSRSNKSRSNPLIIENNANGSKSAVRSSGADDIDFMIALEESKRMFEESLKSKLEEENEKRKLNESLAENSTTEKNKEHTSNINNISLHPKKRLNPFKQEEEEENNKERKGRKSRKDSK